MDNFIPKWEKSFVVVNKEQRTGMVCYCFSVINHDGDRQTSVEKNELKGESENSNEPQENESPRKVDREQEIKTLFQDFRQCQKLKEERVFDHNLWIYHGFYGETSVTLRLLQPVKNQVKACSNCAKKICRFDQQEHVRIMQEMAHPFVAVALTTRCSPSAYLVVVPAYKKCVKDIIESRQNLRLGNDVDARFMSACLTDAVLYLHEKFIIHRNICPYSVHINQSGDPILGSFEQATYHHELGIYMYGQCGTVGYQSPEVVAQLGYNHTLDYWGIGCVAYEFLFGIMPYVDADISRMLSKTVLNPDFAITRLGGRFSRLPKAAQEALRDCFLNRYPHKRVGFKLNDVKQLRWFQPFRWDMLRNREYDSPLKKFVTSASDHEDSGEQGYTSQIPKLKTTLKENMKKGEALHPPQGHDFPETSNRMTGAHGNTAAHHHPTNNNGYKSKYERHAKGRNEHAKAGNLAGSSSSKGDRKDFNNPFCQFGDGRYTSALHAMGINYNQQTAASGVNQRHAAQQEPDHLYRQNIHPNFHNQRNGAVNPTSSGDCNNQRPNHPIMNRYQQPPPVQDNMQNHPHEQHQPQQNTTSIWPWINNLLLDKRNGVPPPGNIQPQDRPMNMQAIEQRDSNGNVSNTSEHQRAPVDECPPPPSAWLVNTNQPSNYNNLFNPQNRVDKIGGEQQQNNMQFTNPVHQPSVANTAMHPQGYQMHPADGSIGHPPPLPAYCLFDQNNVPNSKQRPVDKNYFPQDALNNATHGQCNGTQQRNLPKNIPQSHNECNQQAYPHNFAQNPNNPYRPAAVPSNIPDRNLQGPSQNVPTMQTFPNNANPNHNVRTAIQNVTTQPQGDLLTNTDRHTDCPIPPNNMPYSDATFVNNNKPVAEHLSTGQNQTNGNNQQGLMEGNVNTSEINKFLSKMLKQAVLQDDRSRFMAMFPSNAAREGLQTQTAANSKPQQQAAGEQSHETEVD